MKLLGNIIWFILAVYLLPLVDLVGLLFHYHYWYTNWKTMLNLVTLVITPFGKDVVTHFDKHPPNILWVIFWMGNDVDIYLLVIFIITILGIPFGLQWFKLAKLAFIPFGATIK